MRKLKEIVTSGTDADISANLSKCSAHMRQTAKSIPIAPIDDYVGMVTPNILQFVAAEADAAATALHNDIKLFAWRTRNILEGLLLLKHTAFNHETAKNFCAQRIADEATILEGMIGLNPELSDNNIKAIKERLEKCRTVLKKHGFTKATPWRSDKLAEAVGMKNDYDAFYKLYSKYVHPSSWIIVGDVDEYDNQDYWNVFILNAQLYSNICCGIGDQILTSRSSTLNQSNHNHLH